MGITEHTAPANRAVAMRLPLHDRRDLAVVAVRTRAIDGFLRLLPGAVVARRRTVPEPVVGAWIGRS
jgi:hypothetical protein